MSSPLFRGVYDDFSMPLCANCERPMVAIRYTIEIKGEKVKVCSFQCEEELRVKHNDPRKPLERKPGKPSTRIEM